MPNVESQPLYNVSPPPLHQQPQPKRFRKTKNRGKLKPRHKKLRRLLVVVSVITILGLVAGSQANGPFGAGLADAMRAVLGPTLTAQIESFFLGISDKAHQVEYQLGGQQVQPPWAVPLSPKVVPTATNAAQTGISLTPIKPLISPALPGEGIWVTDGLPGPVGNLPPLVAKTFIRPDPNRPYAIVTLLQFNMRYLNLHLIAGTTQPGGPLGNDGPGKIPATDLSNNALVAVFNGGFKYADGHYGMFANGITYVPPQNGAATLALTKTGQVFIGAWGQDPRLQPSNSNLVAWRQNASMLISNGIVSSLANDGAAWGGTILNVAYTWRSALGVTPAGSLIYAAGDSLSALTLGEALRAAGAVSAMQTDINPYWVRAFLYNRSTAGSLQITKLNSGMQGSGTEYLSGFDRDFFYLTRV